MPNPNNELRATIPEICEFIIGHVFGLAAEASKEILANDPSKGKIQKALNMFGNRKEKRLERLKLNFDLLIPFLTVAAVEIEASKRFNPYFRRMLDELIDLYHQGLGGFSKDLEAGIVDGNYFVKDLKERRLILNELRTSPNLSDLTSLPRVGLTIIADVLLEKRFNEYRQIWISDLKRHEQPGFIAEMPGKVYQHWSGQNAQNWESLQFNLILFAGLTGFSAALQNMLSTVEIDRS
jgi:hypothetical protein